MQIEGLFVSYCMRLMQNVKGLCTLALTCERGIVKMSVLCVQCYNLQERSSCVMVPPHFQACLVDLGLLLQLANPLCTLSYCKADAVLLVPQQPFTYPSGAQG